MFFRRVSEAARKAVRASMLSLCSLLVPRHVFRIFPSGHLPLTPLLCRQCRYVSAFQERHLLRHGDVPFRWWWWWCKGLTTTRMPSSSCRRKAAALMVLVKTPLRPKEVPPPHAEASAPPPSNFSLKRSSPAVETPGMTLPLPLCSSPCLIMLEHKIVFYLDPDIIRSNVSGGPVSYHFGDQFRACWHTQLATWVTTAIFFTVPRTYQRFIYPQYRGFCSPAPALFLSAKVTPSPEREAARHFPPSRFKSRGSIFSSVLPTRRRGLPGNSRREAHCNISCLITGAEFAVVGSRPRRAAPETHFLLPRASKTKASRLRHRPRAALNRVRVYALLYDVIIIALDFCSYY